MSTSADCLENMEPTNAYYISLGMYLYSVPAHFCYIKIHAEMAEKSQVKD